MVDNINYFLVDNTVDNTYTSACIQKIGY
jgi:hypothetical protein